MYFLLLLIDVWLIQRPTYDFQHTVADLSYTCGSITVCVFEFNHGGLQFFSVHLTLETETLVLAAGLSVTLPPLEPDAGRWVEKK